MRIIGTTITMEELRQMACDMLGDLVKAVVDVDKGVLAIDAELHSDLQALLLDHGSALGSLWGINLCPLQSGDHFVEFDSMINMRPSQGNRSNGVEDPGVRASILLVVQKRVIS